MTTITFDCEHCKKSNITSKEQFNLAICRNCLITNFRDAKETMSADVCLRLFYNLGRIPIKKYKLWSSRVVLIKGNCDRTPINIGKNRGYVCKCCGLEIVNRASKLFCSYGCEVKFETTIGTMSWGWYREIIYDRDDGRCKMCGEPILRETPSRWHPSGFTWTRAFVCDHIVPLCYGGKDWYEDPEGTNFQTLCVNCNKEKTRKDMSGPKWIHYNSKLTNFLEPEAVP